jgi:hypothetical protein
VEFRKQKDIDNITSWQPPEVRTNDPLHPCEGRTGSLDAEGALRFPKWVSVGTQGRDVMWSEGLMNPEQCL